MAEYYNSIDNCTQKAWHEVIQTGDLKHIHVSGKFAIDKAEQAWATIFDEYIKEFSLPSSYKSYLKKMTVAMQYYAQWAIGQRDKIVMARIWERDAKMMIHSEEGVNYNETVARLSKYMGYRVNPADVTVREFNSYLLLMNNGE